MGAVEILGKLLLAALLLSVGLCLASCAVWGFWAVMAS